MINNVKKTVQEIIHRYNTRSPFEICENLDITVIMSKLPEHIHGFYHLFYGYKIIHINDELPFVQQKITCAHELGHALLHPRLNSLFLSTSTNFLSSKYENEADLFSVELLIDIKNIIDEYGGNADTLSKLSMITGFNEKVLALKFTK